MNQKARIFDVIRRSIEGPIVSESDFDMKHIYQNLKKIVKKYDIKITSDSFINFDDELSDRVWKAAIEFLAESGVYCKDTGRIVQYTEREIKEAIRMAPRSAVFGEGNDTVYEYPRTADDPRPPVSLGGSINVPCPNEYFVPIMNKIAQCCMLDHQICPYCNPIYGGLGGGLNTQVVLLTAEMIAASTVFMGTTVGTTPTHPSLFCSTTKELLQMTSVAFQAISRNSHIMTRLTHTMVGGLATKTFMFDITGMT